MLSEYQTSQQTTSHNPRRHSQWLIRWLHFSFRRPITQTLRRVKQRPRLTRGQRDPVHS